jgi:hypothetical protein
MIIGIFSTAQFDTLFSSAIYPRNIAIYKLVRLVSIV